MKENLKISLGQTSVPGKKEENEDFHGAYIPDDHQLNDKGIAVAIADGMSGSDGGKEASQISVNQFLSDYYATPESWTVKHAVNKVMTTLNSWLYSQGQERYGSAKGLVTTFSAIILKSQTAHLFHVGDSRIYRFRDNKLVQLTNDHRIWISNDRDYLSRALGIDTHLEIDYRQTLMQPGDIYFLSTDGVHDFVTDAELRALIAEHAGGDPQQLTDAVVRAAEINGSDDNITCQALRIDALPHADKIEFYEKLTKLPFPPDLKRGNIIDGFRIIRELNATSRSQVYLAETTDEQKRKVVIKTPSVNYEDDPTYIDLFLHEEWVAKRLNSPHLIKVCPLDKPRSFLYTVVEYIEGQTLSQWMLDNPKPSLPQVRATVDQIARGLRAMHRMEMIHQDLKPDNILIDKNNTLVIIDFGSTKVSGLAEIQSVLDHSHIVGTANYSAPEYFRGEPGTNRSDLYSLGVIAYEMFTGKLPYGEVTPERAAKKKFVYTPARYYNPAVPEWVDAALRKAVHPNPEKRYSLLSEFVHDLTHPNESLVAATEFQPLVERNPTAFWRLVAAVEGLILLAIAIAWLNGA